jgi:hypothetical protein
MQTFNSIQIFFTDLGTRLELTDVVTKILEKHFQCFLTKLHKDEVWHTIEQLE